MCLSVRTRFLALPLPSSRPHFLQFHPFLTPLLTPLLYILPLLSYPSCALPPSIVSSSPTSPRLPNFLALKLARPLPFFSPPPLSASSPNGSSFLRVCNWENIKKVKAFPILKSIFMKLYALLFYISIFWAVTAGRDSWMAPSSLWCAPLDPTLYCQSRIKSACYIWILSSVWPVTRTSAEAEWGNSSFMLIGVDSSSQAITGRNVLGASHMLSNEESSNKRESHFHRRWNGILNNPNCFFQLSGSFCPHTGSVIRHMSNKQLADVKKKPKTDKKRTCSKLTLDLSHVVWRESLIIHLEVKVSSNFWQKCEMCLINCGITRHCRKCFFNMMTSKECLLLGRRFRAAT